MPGLVTVAIPTLDAGPAFTRTLAAIRAQRIDAQLQLLVCDSGSADDTVDRARAHGADVIQIARAEFSHGGTRNLLMSRARGDHVAFLTQDAVPDGDGWLAALVGAFALGRDVGLAFGPYRPQPGASPMVQRELSAWFQSFSPDGRPRIDALEPDRRDLPPGAFMGHLGFFTDANGCIARAAWERVPFREIAYAEDHLLAQDMLRAGYGKVYVPGAAVIHSHDYSPAQWLRRNFDEARAVREVYGWALDPRAAVANVRGGVAGDVRWARARQGAPDTSDDGPARPGIPLLVASTLHHGARAAGGLLGGHADRLPPALIARLSLEGRA